MATTIPRSSFLLLLLCLVAPVHARQAATEAKIKACIAQAATAFGVSALPVEILRDVEAGDVGTVSKNDNGSYDIGPMQINSSWLPTLARFGIDEPTLRNNPCVNAYVGTWIYAQAWNETKDVAKAMAKYHSPYARHQARYLGLVLQAIDRRVSVGQDLAKRVAMREQQISREVKPIRVYAYRRRWHEAVDAALVSAAFAVILMSLTYVAQHVR